MMFKQCIITAANYGPLLDANPDSDPYKVIDSILADAFQKIINSDVSEEKAIEFMTKSK